MKKAFPGQVEVLLGTAVAITVISVLCIMFFPTAQDFMVGNSLWNGLMLFSDKYKAVTVDSFEQLPELSQQKVFASIPYKSYSQRELLKLREFVTGGGKLLLMDDFGNGNQVLEYLGIQPRFSGEMLLDPLFCYKNPRLPRITKFNPGAEEKGIQAVVLNHATVLTGAGSAKVLAWSSDRSFLDIDGDGKQSPAEPGGPFPVAAQVKWGEGRVIMLSDPSILINSMISREDNHFFLEYLIGYNTEQGDIFVDRSHLEKSRLDKSQLALTRFQEFFSRGPLALGLVALIFVGVSRYMLWKGKNN